MSEQHGAEQHGAGSGAMGLTVRAVRDLDELAHAFDVAGAAEDPPMDHTDWRYDAVRDAFARSRDVDMVAETGGEVVGAALSFRDEGGVRVRLLGVREAYQGAGVGRALLAGLERAAWAAGDGRIYLGSVPSAVGFYRTVGYSLAGTAPAGVTVFEKTPMSLRRLTVTAGAPWLPAGSDAETYQWDAPAPPEPVCLVRVLVRRGDEVLLVETGKGLDLPTRFVAQQPAEGEWRPALAALLEGLGAPPGTRATCIGFVRNVVPAQAEGYAFPVPHAHFAVFEVEGAAVAPSSGRWVPVGELEGTCRERHWWPVVARRLAG